MEPALRGPTFFGIRRSVLCLLGLAAALVLIGAPAARAQTTTAPAPLPPKGSILVDADTGAVLDGLNTHQPLAPASTTKILTALAAVEVLRPGTKLTISARAAGQPAFNLNMKEGQVWVLEDVLGALLLSSANDAAMALAEKVSGSGENFTAALNGIANKLGMVDSPVLQDPAGFDDEWSIGGGNKISPHDLAIAARALLAEPRLASIVASRTYSFDGADGVQHRLLNHNKLLRLYEGAIGMKTGYTKRSMHSLVAAATRNGRTMIAVVMNAPGDTYGIASAMLDKGFATPPGTGARAQLPAVPVAASATPAPAGVDAPVVQRVGDTQVVTAPRPAGRSWFDTFVSFLVKVILGFAAAVAILRIRVKVKDQSPAAMRSRVKMPRHVEPRVRKVQMPAPRPARPVSAERSGPRPKRPSRRAPAPVPQHSARRRRQEPEAEADTPTIDPKLALRFEILARTGQVVP